MKQKGRARTRVLALLVLVTAAVAALAASAHATKSATRHVMTASLQIGHTWSVDGAVDPSQVGALRGCQTRLTPNPLGACYGPDQIRKAYGFDKLLANGVDGTGRTIAIIDAYGSDTINADLTTFNAYFGLPAANLQVVAPFGIDATSNANLAGWKGETTLDVEWAHAIAPAAKILLVVAKSNDDADILKVTQWLADQNSADVLSQSYGDQEACMGAALMTQQHAVFQQLAAQGTTILASSGDQGAGIPSCDGKTLVKATSSPATDPLTTAVGGTQLIAKPATSLSNIGGDWMNEVTWNEGTEIATGGGVSSFWSRPDYQAPVVKDSHMREIPDIAYNAAVNGGVLGVYTCEAWDPQCGSGALIGQFFFRFGGTSAGSPQWAGLVALADQMAGGRVGDLNKTLYHLGKGVAPGTYFHDITVGDNSQAAVGITGYPAVAGYDESTGWGSPIANTLVPAIAKPGNG
jgi:subtilase family serine protease